MAETPTVSRYLKAKASVEKATRNFADVQTIGAKGVLQLKEEGKNVVLVDVRTVEEMEVSMLRGALTREAFESSRLGKSIRTGGKFEKPSGEESDRDVVVPYCTVGYRSGQYAKKLIDLGYPSVRNSEGVLLWTHDIGSGLVTARVNHGTKQETRKSASEETQVSSVNDAGIGAGIDARSGAGMDDGGIEVKRVHVYGPPWDYAREDFKTVVFSPKGWVKSTFNSVFSKVFRRR